VQMMAYEADDLVLNLTPMRQIRCWAGGALEGQVLSMLGRLERRGATHLDSGGSTQARRRG